MLVQHALIVTKHGNNFTHRYHRMQRKRKESVALKFGESSTQDEVEKAEKTRANVIFVVFFSFSFK